MSTMTHTTTTRRIARAEWTKLRTLPSTWRTAVLTMMVAIGFGVALAFSEASQWHTMTAQQRQVFDPASASMSGVMIAAVVLGALAVKTVTAEYSTGMIRATFAAMPARHLVLVAKTGPLRQLRRALTPRGTLVIIGGETGGRWLGGSDITFHP